MFWILFLLLLKENLLCCLAALSFKNELAELERNCYSNVKNTNAKAVGLNKCPHVFSGACWPETLANTTVSLDCPEIFFFPSGKILRRCNESGNWEAVNVTQCRRRTGHPSPDKPPGNDLRVYAALCWVSFLIMVPSLILTLHLFECKNERFNVHTNLILAFIFETVAFFIHYYGNLKHPRNSRMCNAFWIMHRYFSAAEIMWMFNEALLLLRKVVIIFDKKSYMKYYLIIGWGAPFLLIMAAYVPVMVTVVDLAPKKCWYYYRTSTYNLVLYAPLVLVLIANFAVLIYTVSIFVRRQKSQGQSDFVKIRKAIKGTLILTPLLGVIYLLIFFHPEDIPVWYKYLLRVLYPLQGTLACLVYLTFSAELIRKAKLKYRSSLRERRSILENGSLTRSKNPEKSAARKMANSSPFASVDPSCQSRCSPPCDNGPKCGCPDAGISLETADLRDEERDKLFDSTEM